MGDPRVGDSSPKSNCSHAWVSLGKTLNPNCSQWASAVPCMAAATPLVYECACERGNEWPLESIVNNNNVKVLESSIQVQFSYSVNTKFFIYKVFLHQYSLACTFYISISLGNSTGPGRGKLEVVTTKTTVGPWVSSLSAEHLSFLPAAEKEASVHLPLSCNVSLTSKARLPKLLKGERCKTSKR